MSTSRRPRHLALSAAGLALAAAMVAPIGVVILRSVEAGGVEAVARIAQGEGPAIVARSVGLTLGVSALCLAISLPLAWLLTATDLPGRRAWRILLSLPLAVPSYVGGFVVVAAFGPAGWLAELGATLPDVYGPFGAMLALAFVYPYAMLPLIAALERTDPRTFEAARSLGVAPWRAFYRVVLPRLRAAAATGALLIGLYVLSDFGAVSLTRFRSLSYVIYIRYQSLFGRDEAMVYGAILIALAALFVTARLAMDRGGTRTASSGTARPWAPVPLGRWRVPALLFCTTIATYGVGMPLAVVAYWWVRGARNGAPIHPFGDALVGTLSVGAVAAVSIVALALVPAMLSRFGRPTVARAVHAGTHASYALPGIVVALALVSLATQWAPVIYQTIPLLCFAYVIRFLPIASGTLTENVVAQDPRLMDAARSLGASPARAWWRIVLPMTAPAAWAAGLATFVSVIKELPATLILAPIEFETLATHIWAQTEDAFFTSTAPPVLVLVTLAAVVGMMGTRSPRNARA